MAADCPTGWHPLWYSACYKELKCAGRSASAQLRGAQIRAIRFPFSSVSGSALSSVLSDSSYDVLLWR